MLITPGGTAVVEFQSELSGELIALQDPIALIYRGIIETAIAPTITNPSLGIYYVSFTVPVNWVDYDKINCKLSGTINGKPVGLVKPVGVVLSSAFEEGDRQQLQAIERLAVAIAKPIGRAGTTATQKNPTASAPGFIRFGDGEEQEITLNPDGSLTISPPV